MKIKNLKVINLQNQFDQRVLPDYVQLDQVMKVFVHYDSRTKKETFILTSDTTKEYNPINNDWIYFSDKLVLERYFKLID